MVDCTGLENRRAFAGSVSSNLTLSAKIKILPEVVGFFIFEGGVRFEENLQLCIGCEASNAECLATMA